MSYLARGLRAATGPSAAALSPSLPSTSPLAPFAAGEGTALTEHNDELDTPAKPIDAALGPPPPAGEREPGATTGRSPSQAPIAFAVVRAAELELPAPATRTIEHLRTESQHEHTREWVRERRVVSLQPGSSPPPPDAAARRESPPISSPPSSPEPPAPPPVASPLRPTVERAASMPPVAPPAPRSEVSIGEIVVEVTPPTPKRPARPRPQPYPADVSAAAHSCIGSLRSSTRRLGGGRRR